MACMCVKWKKRADLLMLQDLLVLRDEGQLPVLSVVSCLWHLAGTGRRNSSKVHENSQGYATICKILVYISSDRK